jgi:anti-sigma factor RsiW
MSDDARAMRGNDLSHDDAQALISARMDGPLDSERNRALLAHLAGCPTCAAFAAVMEGMTVGFREIPVLPPSPVVARAVRAEVRKTGVFRSFGRWLTSSRGLPLGALGAATVALAIVAASTFGPLADRVAGPQVAAPQASVGGGDVAIR